MYIHIKKIEILLKYENRDIDEVVTTLMRHLSGGFYRAHSRYGRRGIAACTDFI